MADNRSCSGCRPPRCASESFAKVDPKNLDMPSGTRGLIKTAVTYRTRSRCQIRSSGLCLLDLCQSANMAARTRFDGDGAELSEALLPFVQQGGKNWLKDDESEVVKKATVDQDASCKHVNSVCTIRILVDRGILDRPFDLASTRLLALASTRLVLSLFAVCDTATELTRSFRMRSFDTCRSS